MIDGEWDGFVPIRLPVDWEYRGEAGIHPEIEGITGKEVVLLIEKRFTRFEKILAKILKWKSRSDNPFFLCNVSFTLYYSNFVKLLE